MKSVTKKSGKKAAFTIVELLTVMSIIVILIGLLVPALNMVRKYAKEVKQQAQFHSIGVALEFFNGEFDSYPDSSEKDNKDNLYCGAMKLAEAMVGKDLMGVHPDTIFNSLGEDHSGNNLYVPATRNARKGPYLPIENANAYKVSDVYTNYNNNSSNVKFDADSKVLCDVFGQVISKGTGEKIGMPILYYKAHPSKIEYSAADAANSIYNYLDNQDLLLLGKPFENNDPHELAENNGERFYLNTTNPKVTNVTVPYNRDSYILISAGFDGEYGTSDDICNFEYKYK